MNNQKRFTQLCQKFPGRQKQLRLLFNIYGYKEEPFVDTLFLHGGASAGKSSVVISLLKSLNINFALVNLIECYTGKILLESILNKLTNHKIDIQNPHSYAKCDGMMEFVNNLKKCGFELNSSVIILDKAENLRNMDFNLLPCFFKLRELSGINISVIFLSEIPLYKFYNKRFLIEPIEICFPQYKMEEILEIILLDFNEVTELLPPDFFNSSDIDEDFYQNYLNIFVSVFYRACRDLSELRYMARINFVKYCDPLIKNECKTSDSMFLWNKVSPILKSSLEVLYLRLSNNDSIDKTIDSNAENSSLTLELPFYAKYLLIAAYLASYNPAKDDKRLFVKYGKNPKPSLRGVKSRSKMTEQLNTVLGPKPFSFDRLLAIFYSILDDKVGFNNNLLVQVSSLVQLQLLTSLSDNYNLDGQKFKCSVNFEFIQNISKMVGFNIRKYLSDFSHM